ncbi:MAG TPA: DUF448 domain-containing protein [Novosphingobium sp.]|nr:DUF448 domain-containing protein [Novosphingobium sp.]
MRIPHNEPLGSGTSKQPASGDPERRCILTGDHGSRDDLLRLAISPDGLVLPDALARAPGRGAWIGVSRADLETALAKGKLKGALARAFKGAELSIPDDLPQRAEAALRRAFTDRLGLEMKSGKLLLGSDRIAENARMGNVAWLAHAADASDDGSRKLDQAWRVGRETEGSGETGLTLPLDRAALSVALGRENVVHLALTDPRSAERVDAPLRRLLRFLGQGHTNEQGRGDSAADPAGPSPVTTN